MMEEKLPKGWKKTVLGSVTEWSSGGTPRRGVPEYYYGEIPWVKTGDLNEGYLFKASEFISEEGLKYSSAKLYPKGSIVMAMYGATIGKVSILGIDAATNQACAVAKPSETILNKFLFYYLKSQKKEFVEKGKGGAQPNISLTVIKNHSIPLPPLPEQQRIVAKLDALFGHLDSLREKLDGIPALLKNFRQQVLTQAVTGELTKEWREGKGYTNNEGPIPIPNDWNFRHLKQLSHSLKYGSSSKSENIGDVPVLRMGNIQDGEIDWSDLKYSSNLEEIEKYELASGDLLFNRTNSPELVGKTAKYRGKREAIFAGYLIQIKPKESINSEFLNFVLNSSYSKKWCWEVKTDGVSQSNINAKKLGDFLVPVPSLEEQDEIVSKVNVLFEISKRIESQYASLKSKIDQLPQAILAKAFRGELVAQEVKEYVVEVREDLMAAEGGELYKFKTKT